MEWVREEALRWLCCKICVRSLFMKDFYDAFFGEELRGIPLNETKIQKRHTDLIHRYEAMEAIKLENQSLRLKMNSQEEKISQHEENLQKNIEQFKETLTLVQTRNEKNDLKITNRRVRLE